MLNNGYLHLITWLIEHTELVEDVETTTEELKTAYLNEADVPEFILNHNRISSKIGSFLFMIYGSSLIRCRKRHGAKPCTFYNVRCSVSKVRTVAISEGADLIEC